MKIGVMGACGVVGQALARVMAQAHEVAGYDPRMCEHHNRDHKTNYGLWDEAKRQWHGKGDLLGCAIIFICAPTPWNEQAQDFDCEPVKDCLVKLGEAGYPGVVVLKSTTLPTKIRALLEVAANARKNAGWGETHRFNLVACPEFLNARTAYEDTRDAQHVVIGGAKEDRQLVLQAYKEAQPGIQGYFLETPEEAMMLKYMQNTYFATKNALFNQFYTVCRQFAWDYDAVRSGIVLDDRVHPVHTDVPGYDGERGYGGACLPKDVKAMQTVFDRVFGEKSLLAAVNEYNNFIRSGDVRSQP